MRLLPVRRVVPGMRLGREIDSGPAGTAPLLRVGAVLNERTIARLLAKGINAVWVEDELSAGIEPVSAISDETRTEAHATATAAFDEARSALGAGQQLRDETVASLARVAARIARDIASRPNAAITLGELAAADAYTYRHSVNVAIGGVLIATELFRRNGWIDHRGQRRFDRLEERLTLLGVGLMLHDVGKLVIPLSVLHKPAPLTAEEWDLMRGHPEAGVALLSAERVSPLVFAVVAGHHERCDGTGYPRGLTGDRIHQYARIAAVADVYDAVTSDRPYRDAAPPVEGVRAILAGGAGFDPEVVEAFRSVILPYPPGCPVQLPDGREGIVVSADARDPERPLVRVPLRRGYEEIEVELPLADPVGG